jgi:arabinose-5-phosphate isomerase
VTSARTQVSRIDKAAADRVGLAAARRTLTIGAEALAALAAALDRDFAAAVDCLAAVRGRVVVSGMGKSGHVARKIAATLSSTGTPALFVHPGEASHGDLGMIAAGDAILVLSNSGKTVELADIVAYAKRFRIPLIAMVGAHGGPGKPGAFVADAADVALALPAAPEACPLGLAPTTSTTMMLALGDALAVALLERKGFSSDDFRALHPGGRLARTAVTRVADIMHTGTGVPLLPPTASMGEALIEMSNKGLGCVGIVDGDRLIGIITDGDLRRHMAPDLLARSVTEIMTAGPRTIGPGALAAEALGIMNAGGPKPITTLFVTEDGRPVGVLHIHDCLRAGIA